MPSQAEFEYQFRWADLATLGLSAVVDELEARDQALEQFLADGYGSGTCFINFTYTYRWAQILEAPLANQMAMLDARDVAFEQAIRDAGGCTLEFPFRWVQFWESLLLGEPWAVGIAEENDRAIEMRFGLCTCTGFITTWQSLSFLSPASETSVDYTVVDATSILSISYQMSVIFIDTYFPVTLVGYVNGTPFFSDVVPSTGVAEFDVPVGVSVTTGDIITFTLTGSGSPGENSYFLSTGGDVEPGIILSMAGTGINENTPWLP